MNRLAATRWTRVAILCLIVAGGAYWWVQRSGDDGPIKGQAAEGTPVSAVRGQAADFESALAEQRRLIETLPGPAEISSDMDAAMLSAVREVYSSASAAEMDRALDELARHDPLLAEYRRRDLPDFCNPIFQEYGSEDHLKPARQQFCADYERPEVPVTDVNEIFFGEPGEEQFEYFVERTALRNEMNDRVEALESRIGDAPEEARSELFTRLVRDARFPEQLLELISINERHARAHGMIPLWQMGNDIGRAYFPDSILLDAQTVALQLYGCRRFGGCGHDQYWTMLACQSWLIGRCRAGAGLDDVLYLTTPPVDYALALEILGQL